jgi:hypothetical protein
MRSYWDWELTKDKNLLDILLKQAQTPQHSSMEDIAARLAGLLKQQLSTPGEELSETTRVDGLPQTLNLQNWKEGGTNYLTLGDLKDAATFRQWFQQNNMTTQSGNNPPATLETGWDQCLAIQFIYNRAQNYAANYVAESKLWSAEYLKRITQIAAETKCKLDKSSSTAVPGSTTHLSNSQQTIGQESVLVDQIAGLTPFNYNYIDFDFIKQFVDLYSQLNPTRVASMQDQITQDIKALKDLGAEDHFDVSEIRPEILATMTRNPYKFAIILYDLVKRSANLYGDFVTHYHKEIGDQDRKCLQQQSLAASIANRMFGLLSQVQEQAKRPH